MQFDWNLSDTNTNVYNTNGIYTKQINYHTHYTIEMKGKKNSNRNYRIQINTKEYTWKLQTTNKIVYNTNGTDRECNVWHASVCHTKNLLCTLTLLTTLFLLIYVAWLSS